MAKTYSIDLRKRVVAMYDEGHSYEDVGTHFKVHPRTVRNLVKLRDETGSVAPRPHGGAPPEKLDEQDRLVLKRLHEADNDAYLRELSERLAKETGKVVSIETVRRELLKMGITRKKNTSKRPSKTEKRSRSQDRNS